MPSLASQQQIVVGAIMRRYGDEFAARLAPGSEPVAPLFVSEVRELDDGEVTLDERRRTKQPDWTFGARWSGATPVDLFID